LCWAEKADNYSALCRAAASVNDNRARNREESSIIADFGPDRHLLRRGKACSGHEYSRYCHLSRFYYLFETAFMSTTHKNKTFATLLAVLLGGLGAHRFYLRGSLDKLGLLHLTALPIAGLVVGLAPQADWFFKILPLLLSYVVGFVEALALGVMADEKFDAAFNPNSGKKSESKWYLALLLVFTMLLGMTVMIGTMSRLVDLLYTGGAYG
jgi:TM2 domain-containing membrane protein YozV